MPNPHQKNQLLAVRLAVMSIVLAALAGGSVLLLAGPPPGAVAAAGSVLVAGLLAYAICRAHTADQDTTLAALVAACDEAVCASQLKSQILATVSHDLRTPLSSILNYAEIMLQGMIGPVTDQQKETLTRLTSSTEQLLSFVSKLLDSAQLDANKMELEMIAFPPAELLAGIDAMANGQASRKGLTLLTEIDPAVPKQVIGDLRRLEQIVGNLVGNAIKFTEHGSVAVRIFCPDADHWAVAVTDTGPGIREEAQVHIFDAFWQAGGKQSDQREKGSGLGLYIVQQMTCLMDGEVTLRSVVGKGTTFTITLPLLPVEAAEAALALPPTA